LTQTGGNHINPNWNQNGDEIIFISDMDGIPNVYSMDLETRDLYRITNFITGVAGIVTESPAVTIATETGRLAFSAFSDGGWNIYTLDEDEYEKEKIDGGIAVAVLDALEDVNDKYREYPLPDSSEFLLSGYKSKLTADLIVGGGAFATNVGFAGQTAFLFSDMLGDKNLLIQAALYGDPLESTIIATYYNQSRRLNWSLSAFQFRDDFGAFTAPNEASFRSRIFRGVGVGASRPFSPFTRIELNSNLYFVAEDIVNINFNTGETIAGASGTSIFTNVGASFIRDTALWGVAAPVSGTRARFSVEQNLGELRYSLLFADFRKYFAISFPRYSIAYRLSSGATLGENERIFFIGGPFTFRGADWGRLTGTRMAYSNLEFRFPLLPFLPIQYDFLTGVAFFDAANAWGMDRFGLSTPFNDDNPDDFFNYGIKTSYGLGFRFNLGGLLVLRWDFVLKRPHDIFPIVDREGNPVAFGPKGPKTFFSIGLDF